MPHRTRGVPATRPDGPADRPRDLYGSLSTLFGIGMRPGLLVHHDHQPPELHRRVGQGLGPGLGDLAFEVVDLDQGVIQLAGGRQLGTLHAHLCFSCRRTRPTVLSRTLNRLRAVQGPGQFLVWEIAERPAPDNLMALATPQELSQETERQVGLRA